MVRKPVYILFYLLIITSIQIFAQETRKIDILNADDIMFNEFENADVQKLIGNVVFFHDETTMHCDSAYFYRNVNMLDAFSNIHIFKGDTMHLYGDYLRYNGATKMAEVRRNVKLVDKEAYLLSDSLDYNLNSDLGYYFNGGKIFNGENTLTSTFGYYYTNTDVSYFKDSVVIVNPDYNIYSDTIEYNTNTKVAYFYGPTEIISDSNYIYCEDGWYDTETDMAQLNRNAYILSDEYKILGDSLYYDRNQGFGLATWWVEIHDTVNHTILAGNYGEFYEEKDIALITDSALFIQVEEGDSLFLHADTLRSVVDTSDQKIILAYNKVKFYRSTLQGKADSLTFYVEDSVIHMFYEPVLWTEDKQVTGEKIEIYTTSSGIDYMEVKDDAFIVMQEDSVKYNQISGRNMTTYFQDNSLYRIDVNGNGKTIFYPKEEEDIIGMNKTESSNLRIYVLENEIDRIVFIENPKATLYPLNETPENEKKLAGFKWLKDYRPMKKEDIFYWVE